MADVTAAPVGASPSVAGGTMHADTTASVAHVAIAPSTAEGAMQALQSLQGMGPIEAMATLDSIQEEAVQALEEQARKALYASPAPGPQATTSTPTKSKASQKAGSTPIFVPCWTQDFT